MIEHTGWLLDVYADPRGGIVLWLLAEDGKRHRLHQSFPITFYAAGPTAHLRALWRFLEDQPVSLHLQRNQRRELFSKEPLTVLSVQVTNPAAQPRLFRRVTKAFPEQQHISYYDADLPLALRFAAVHNTFPLARCQVTADKDGTIHDLNVLDSPWDIDPPTAALRILSLEPNTDPFHAEPTHLLLRSSDSSYRLALEPSRSLLVNLRAILQRHNPDLLLTMWGDTWMLPYLLKLSRRRNIPLPLNRDEERNVIHRPERSYFSYGRVIYRGRQVHLFGRWHIDGHNAMLFHDYGVEGVLELARVTSLPVQTVARVSPGTGISSMQMLTALRQGILVPWHKQQAERPKTALELVRVDQGGLVYQPTIGLHRDVAEIDFISMYPSIMARFNISPETVGTGRPTAEIVPELGMVVDRNRPGLVPQTLKPLLDKRVELKSRLATMPAWHPTRSAYKARSSAHKWLLVTCFGYLGYKNARFGRIEAHEAVTAYGREALLRAKEAAEDMGFKVLHMYVDGLWVQQEGRSSVPDFHPLLEEIIERTGLPISLDGIYRWVAFLPSRVNSKVPVPNRYFGVFQNGSMKLRGIETRRRDTPPFISEIQMEMLKMLAQDQSADTLSQHLPQLVRLLRRCVANLRAQRIPMEQLLVSQKLSRELGEYRIPSPSARAAAQLKKIGKTLRPGQRVRFIHTLGEPGVYAWDLPEMPVPESIDINHYTDLLLRAASTVVQPLGVSEDTLRNWVLFNVGYLSPPGVVPPPERLLPLALPRHVASRCGV